MRYIPILLVQISLTVSCRLQVKNLWPSDHAGIVARLAFSIQKQIDINITGAPVVGRSTKKILTADYRNFTAGDPYNITIIKISNSLEVFTENGILKGRPEQTIPIGWKPQDKGHYLVVAKGDTISASNKIMAIDSEVVSRYRSFLPFGIYFTGSPWAFRAYQEES